MKQPSHLSFDNTKVAFAYQSDQSLKKARLIFSMMRYGWLVRIATLVAPWALRVGLPVRGLIRRTVFAHFCGGESLDEAAETARRMEPFQVGVILDYGVEAAEGEQNYDRTAAELERAVSCAARQQNIPFISLKVTGFARFSLLEKIDAGAALTVGEQEEFDRTRSRIYAVCTRASLEHIGVLIDAEESWIQRPVDTLASEMMASFNREHPVVYNTLQLYRHDRLSFLESSFAHACREGYILGAKLVRGAYMEKERKRAERSGYPSPIQPDKEATDHAYDQAVRFCLERLDRVATFIGTHNEQSCKLGADLLRDGGVPPDHPHVHFSQLYGMSDHITYNLAAAGYRVSKYVPYGPIGEVMPYLIRRAHENSSISGQLGREQQLVEAELKRRNLL